MSTILAVPSMLVLAVPVPNIDQVVKLYDRIKIYRSTTGAGGTYTEITTSTTRPRLDLATKLYEFRDVTGTTASWYKVSFYNAESNTDSALSGPRHPYDEQADTNVLTVQELKDVYLTGVNLTDDDAVPYPDEVFTWGIRMAIDWLEKTVGITIRKKVITGQRYDYFRRDYQEWVSIQLREKPVISVEQVQIMWPSDTLVMTFDHSWLHWRDSGQLNIVPTAGTLSQVMLTVGGSFLPFIAVGRDWVPDIFNIDYTAGFAEGEVPPLVRDCIGMKASFAPLNLAGDLIGGPGIASSSISMDGLSQSVNTTSSAENAGYSGRLRQYERSLPEMVKQLRRTYQGISMVAL
jgi:hypothetical protein